MKIFYALVLALALLGLCGCGQTPIAEETTAGQSTVEETTEETTADESTEGPEWPPKQNLYPYTEIDARLREGYYSVNELTKHFGEPIKLTGKLVAYNSPDDCVCGLTAEFKDAAFELWDSVDGQRLSYNAEIDSTGTYEEFSARVVPAQADKALRLELAVITVTGRDIRLPRGIGIGDSLEKVRAAYPAAPGRERENEDGVLFLDYWYYSKKDEAEVQEFGWIEFPYGISYQFYDGKLTQAEITWFNGWARFD